MLDSENTLPCGGGHDKKQRETLKINLQQVTREMGIPGNTTYIRQNREGKTQYEVHKTIKIKQEMANTETH